MSYPRPASAAAKKADRASQYDAVKLFLQGARRAQPGFALTADNLSSVVDVCNLVEGMPLGIRLAAASVDVLTPAEIAAEIGRNLDFLQTDRSDVPERQRSMRATLDYSWNLLTGRQREVLQALSVFRGGFTREAAQQVAGASVRELMSLFHRSLLHRTSTGRYGLHELLRQFAARELDESPGASRLARDRHSAYFVAALQQWGADLKGPRQQDTLAEMDVEFENARAALDWAAEQVQVERIGQAIEGLCLFCVRRGRYQDGVAICRLATERLSATASDSGLDLSAVEALRVGAKVLAWQGAFCRLTGRIKVATQLLERGLLQLARPELAACDTRADKAFILLERGRVASDSERAHARQRYEHSLALYQDLGDRWGMANALDRLGWFALLQCRYGEAQRLQEKSLAIRRLLGDRAGIAHSLSWQAGIAERQGRFEEAEGWLRTAISFFREMGNQVDAARGLPELGIILQGLGK
jgi:tetratricopeptide (TPR) repeat protein